MAAKPTSFISVSNPSDFKSLHLSQNVLKAVEDLGYQSPSPVQAQAIPAVLSGCDVMAAAQTGTGKTAAFLLPSLDRLGHARRGQGPLMLVVTPTRELAQQIDEVSSVICRHTGHHAVVLVGGVGYEPQKKALKKGCDLLVATPGRLIDLLNQGFADLSQVQTLVLDEADRMLDMGFIRDIRRIVKETPSSRQTLLFSATLSDDVLSNTRELVHDPARIEIAPKGTVAETVDQYVLPLEASEKNAVLPRLLKLEGSERVIVFCRGKHRADGLCRKLRKAGITCAPIHGNRSQNQRQHSLERFRQGEVDVLVATDVLARGIDIPDVSYVVNFDVPGEAEDYIHRIGRTGRAGESGWAITFVTEDDYLDLRDAEKLMGKVIPTYTRGQELGLEGGTPWFKEGRNPKEKLPNKKARKKMAQQRAAAREAGGEGSGATRRIVRNSRQRGSRSQGDGPRRAQGARQEGRPERVSRGSRPSSQAKANGDGNRSRARRHPGDHGGARASARR